MVGVGVLTTAGFMALDLSPGLILLDWLLGGIVALAGAVAYGALVWLVPRSGGEYRYLSSLLHPAAGYLAGWTSLLVGFSVPTALAALGAGAFAQAILPSLDPRVVAAIIIALVTASHALSLHASRWTQDVLALCKAVLIAGFILIGLSFGRNSVLDWTPTIEGGAVAEPLFTSLIFVTFCYSGWNAASYVAEEFREPRRDVPRSMVFGCLVVTGVYLAVNWVFVTNLSHADMTEWIKGDTDRITLAHLVMQNLLGHTAATVMSGVMIIALASAISAMTLVGPRVYAAMASDRFLPSIFAPREGKPPIGSVLLQGGLATVLVFVGEFRELLNNVGSILALVSGATVLCLFRRRHWGEAKPSPLALTGAVVYAAMSCWMLYYAMRASPKVAVFGVATPTLSLWIVGIATAALTGYLTTRAARSRQGM